MTDTATNPLTDPLVVNLGEILPQERLPTLAAAHADEGPIPAGEVLALVQATADAVGAAAAEHYFRAGCLHAELVRQKMRTAAAYLAAEYGTAAHPTTINLDNKLNLPERERVVERNERGDITRTVERDLPA